jgi:hypothetical protein|tara:strand:+ start:3062 stop:3199 length:138 start_codon:yes stop_codon:yes gene_type:complete
MKTELMTVPHFLGDGNISTKEQEIQKAYDHFPPPDSNAGKIAVYQ